VKLVFGLFETKDVIFIVESWKLTDINNNPNQFYLVGLKTEQN
jgi:hypothetical protein